jgi:translocation and assembly module TamB
MRPKILKAIGIFLGVLILLILGISIFLQTDYSKDIIKTLVENSVSSATNQTFTIGEVETDFIHGTKLTDVSLKVEGEPFVHSKEASVRYSLLLILNSLILSKKVVTLNDVILLDSDVNLIQYKDGSWNFNKIGGKKDEKEKKEKKQKELSDWNIILQNFLLKNAEIKIENRKENKVTQIEIPKINLSLKMIGITNKVELDLKGADLNVSPHKINVINLTTKAVYAEDEVRIEDLKTNLNGAEIKLDGVVSNFKEPEFKINASAHGYKIKEVGVLNAEIEGSGKYRSPQDIKAEVHIKMPNSQIRGRKIWGSIEKVTIDGTELKVNNGAVKTDFGETSFEGNANLERILTKEGINEFNLDISLKNIETPEIFALIEKKPDIINTDLNAKLNSNFDVNGSWEEIDDLKAKVNIDKFRLEGKGAGEVDMKGLLEATKSNVKFDLRSNLNKVNLASILGDNKYRSNITSNLDLKASFALRGDLLDNLTANVQAKILPSSILDIKLSQGNINASYAKNTLDIKTLSLVSDDFKLKAQGTMTQKKGTAIDYQAEVKNLVFLSKFSPDLDLKGSLKANGKVQGDIKKPEITLSAELSDFGYKENIEIKSVELNGKGIVDIENPNFQVDGTLSGLQINDRNIESAKLEARSVGKGLGGEASIIEDSNRSYEIALKLADLQNKEKDLEVTKLKLDLENTVLQNKNSINITIAPKKLIIESFNLYYKDSSVLADANMDFDGKMSADLRLSNLNLRDISNALQLEPPIEGITWANISLQGTVEDPRIKAAINAQNLGYIKFASDKAVLDFSYMNKRLDLNLNASENGREILLAKGTADVDLNLKKIGENIKSANLDLVVKSSGFELSPIAAFTKEIEKIQGKLIIDLRMSGNLKNPELRGQAKLQEAFLKIQSLRNELKIANALIDIQGQKGFLRTLEIQTDGGNGTFVGDFNFTDLSYNLNGKMNGLQVEPKAVSATLDGNVDVKGSGGKIDISGNLKVKRARITIPEKPEKKVDEIKFVDEEKPEEFVIEDTKENDFFKDNVAMNLSVTISRNAWVRGKGANVEIQGDVEVKKKYGNPQIVTGTVSTVRGTYQIFGKLFKIEEGRVSFPGTTEIDPFLDITALYRVSNVDIFVNLGGRVSEPKIQLSSNPAMEETDIISYLVFGSSSDKLGTGERSSLDQVAAGVAGGIAARELKNLIGEEFSLDVISIGGGQSGPQVELGKYLTDDLYIGYQRSTTQSSTTAPAATNNVRVEYRLFDFLTLESEIGGEQAGGDIFFNFNY